MPPPSATPLFPPYHLPPTPSTSTTTTITTPLLPFDHATYSGSGRPDDARNNASAPRLRFSEAELKAALIPEAEVRVMRDGSN